MLVVQLKKIMTQESVSLKKKITDHNHDKYITTREFNTSAASVFSTRNFHNKNRF